MSEALITNAQIAELAHQQAELASLIDEYPSAHESGGPVGEGVSIVRTTSFSRIDLSQKLSSPEIVQGLGEGSISLIALAQPNRHWPRRLFPQPVLLIIKNYMDNSTRRAVEKFLQENPQAAPRLATIFVFDPLGFWTKITAQPEGLVSSRRVIHQTPGSKWVKSQLKADDLAVVADAHTRLEAILRRPTRYILAQGA